MVKIQMKPGEKIMFAAFFGIVGLVTILGQSARTSSNSHAEHPAQQVSISEGSLAHNDSHRGHSQEKPSGASVSAQVKLTTLEAIVQDKPTLLVIDVQDPKGKAIANFDTFQEKLMHLIVVSDNLQVFQHLHPNYKGSGRFEVETTLPQAGNYTLISDYKPTGQKETVSVLKASVPGNPVTASAITLDRTKVVDTTQVNLALSEPLPKAGQEVMLSFNLRDTSNNQSIQDLKPYLGEQGHLVILKQSSPLTRADYIHAHAMEGTSTAKVEFMTTFPKPGKYKLWGQFNRNGRIVVADFWVNVL
jgi:hypothetical protein